MLGSRILDRVQLEECFGKSVGCASANGTLQSCLTSQTNGCFLSLCSQLLAGSSLWETGLGSKVWKVQNTETGTSGLYFPYSGRPERHSVMTATPVNSLGIPKLLYFKKKVDHTIRI